MAYPIIEPLRKFLRKFGLIRQDFLDTDNLHLWGRSYIKPTNYSIVPPNPNLKTRNFHPTSLKN